MEGSRRRSLAFRLLGRQRGHLQAWEGREALESLDGLFLEPAVCPAVPDGWGLVAGPGGGVWGGGRVAKSGEEVLRGPRVLWAKGL